MIKKIYELSNIGRVAYAIRCLENAIIHFGHDLVGWRAILKQLWSCTQAADMTKWLKETEKKLPQSILIGVNNHRLQCDEEITAWEAESLYSLYLASDDAVIEIADAIYDIAACICYKSAAETADEQVWYIEKIYNLSQQEEFPMPLAEDILKYEKAQKGKLYDGCELSVLVNNSKYEPEVLEFADISVLGRVAYAICCLEKIFASSGYINDKVLKFIELLGSCTNSMLDVWQDKIADILPNCFMQGNSEFCEECGISSDELKALYNSDAAIPVITELIYYMCTCELYGKISGNSPMTLEKLNEVFQIMKCRKSEVPEISEFKKFSFNIDSGWGEQFDFREISLLVK